MSRIYIGRLPYRSTERDVERFFKGFGRLRDIVLKNGYGFVEFEDDRDADDAVYDLNGKTLCGERVVIEHARIPPSGGGRGGGDRGGGDRGGGGGYGDRDRGRSPRRERSRYGPPQRTEYRVIVENLSSRVSWQDLKDLMRKAGEVTYADAHKGRQNEGIVEFSSSSDMRRAVEKFDGHEMHGRTLKVYEDKAKSSRRSRSQSRSRSRSRSRRKRSRSRSRSRSHKRRDSRSASRSKSRSRSERKQSKSRSRSRKRSQSGEKRSRSRDGSEPRTNGKVENDNKSKSGSKSRSHSRSKSRSKSPVKSDRSRSGSRGRDEDDGDMKMQDEDTRDNSDDAKSNHFDEEDD